MQNITPTPTPCPVHMESADDALAASYISSHNTGVSDYTKWQTVATTAELETLGHHGKEMIDKLTHSIQAVISIYETKLEEQELKYNQLYYKLSEAAALAEATTSTSQQHPSHLETLWTQCQ